MGSFNSGLGSDLVKSQKKIAESVVSKVPFSRKGTITDFDIKRYSLDVDLNVPMGHAILYDKPIITPYAGNGYGFICSQREGHSVVTLPVDGDPSNSVVIGRVFEKGAVNPPIFNYGDVLLRHELGHQWSFTYSQPVIGSMNLDMANLLELEEIPLEAPEKYERKLFKVFPLSGEAIEEGQVIRVILKYETNDTTKGYLNVYVEWEAKVEINDNGDFIINITDGNTIVGGPLKTSVGTSNDKNYNSYEVEKYQAILLSPPKGNASFSHYMGMGLFMEEYPSRIPIGCRNDNNETTEDGRFLVDENGNLKSWLWNNDSFLDNTLDENGRLDNFPRGAISLLHYSKSGLFINEKAAKTYELPLDNDGFEWQQSAIGMSLALFRQRPSPYIVPGLNDPEAPIAALILEDDCKNAEFNSVHIRLSQENTAVQKITKEEIALYDVQHYDTPYDVGSRLENPLSGTRPSRLQFYDLKRKPTEIENLLDDFKCSHFIKPSEEADYDIQDGNKCKLNYKKVKDPNAPNGFKNVLVSKAERMATFESGVPDKKTGKKECPHWPGCIEGHYTHPDIDKPLEVRNTDIRINNLDLLIKPKANLELVHYTNSGLFIEEQLPTDANGIVYDNVSVYHAPKVTLRLREWDYVPVSDGSNVINYKDGEKNNAHEPKRYDICKVEMETIYGVREQNFEEVNKIATYTDQHSTYKTASAIRIAQTVYGNKILPEDKEIQLGNRLIFEDLLTGTAPNETVPDGIWEESDNTKDAKIEGADKDIRLILPKGKLELMHYTNSGLIIQEDKNALTDSTHKPSMALIFNYWMHAAGEDGTMYRPMTPSLDNLDQIGTIKWEETADSADPTASLVDFYIYHNTARDQHLTLDPPTDWWDGQAEGGPGKTGAFIAIRESDNAAQLQPVVEMTDSINSIKMDAKQGATKVEITNRTTQFTNQEAGVNKIIMDAAAQLLSLINGYDGGAKDGNNSIEMDKANGLITIQDANGNNIVIDSQNKKIVITDVDNTNSITLDSTGILLDSNGTTITVNNGGDINMAAGGSTIDVAKDGDIDITSAAKITIRGTAGVIIEDSQVKITGGTLTVDGISAPSGSGGPFNSIPACVFSGALHCGNMVSGT